MKALWKYVLTTLLQLIYHWSSFKTGDVSAATIVIWNRLIVDDHDMKRIYNEELGASINDKTQNRLSLAYYV